MYVYIRISWLIALPCCKIYGIFRVCAMLQFNLAWPFAKHSTNTIPLDVTYFMHFIYLPSNGKMATV